MALVVKDRVKETTTTTGTGTITLAGAVGGFQTFSAIGDGNVTYYCIAEKTGTAWEVGYGTYTASGTTLSRTVVLESSNAGSLVDFGAGTKEVFCTYPAERAVYQNEAGSETVQATFDTVSATTANLTAAALTTGTISTTPSNANDITNKTYVDTLVASGIHFHQPVRVESPINLNATYNNGTSGVGATLTNAGTQAALVIDGVTVSVNDRVLVYQQTTQTQNGIYVVTDVGSGATNWILTRSTDADTYVINSANGLSEGSTVFVQEGATGAGESYTCNTSGVITFGTTNITFAQISSTQIYSAGTGLTLSGTQFSITNTGTAGTYGSASAVPVFVTNAQGQVTSVTNTSIAITGAAVSGDIAGNAGSATVLQTARNINGVSFNGSANIDVNTNNAATFNDSGTGAASGSTFNGGSLLTVSYNTIGAPSTTGTNASGNWNINVTGSAASATTAGNVSGVVAVVNGGTGGTTSTGSGAVVLAAAPALTGAATIDSVEIGYRGIPSAGAAKTTSYTLAVGDKGELVEVGSGGSITVPDATFAAGDAVVIFNNTSGAITLTMSITTAYIGGTDSDKSTISLATRGICNVLFISGTVCVVTGNVT